MDYNDFKTILVEFHGNVVRVILNRPEVHNAFNNELIDDLYEAFTNLNKESDVRAIILTGNGKSFCAGADLNWMKSVINNTFRENFEESLKLANLMHLIFTHSKPVIAKVNGAAIGGGVGLMSVCDILIASDKAKFGLSEVKLGLVPAAISPFVMSRIGEANARELFITGERIDAEYAHKIGLVNQVAPLESLDEAVNKKLEFILQNGPEAVKVVKKMIYDVSQKKFPELLEYTADIIANLRISKEGQEGMNAFLEKRKPSWRE